MMPSRLSEWGSLLGSLFFPAFCRYCQSWLGLGQGNFFCPACWEKILPVENCCTCCGQPAATQTGSLLCSHCRKKIPPFRRARAVGIYDEGILRQAIHIFKYEGKIGLGRRLGQLMVEHSSRCWPNWEYDFILPVPLHPKRLRRREFNQSFILADSLGQHFNTPLLSSHLERSRFNPPQAGLKQKERLANVKGCFSLHKPEVIRGKKLLLVDDVYTTGATVGECARVLTKAGAEALDVYTLGRTQSPIR